MLENSTATKLMELEIKNRKYVLGLYEKIIPVVKKFDGKILNKRFDTALKEVEEHLGFDRHYSTFSINWWANNDHVSCGEPDAWGVRTVSYIKNRNLDLTSMLYGCPDSTFPDRVMVDSDGRIKANVILMALDEGKKQLEKEIISFEESMKKIPEYKKKLEELKAEIENTTREIPYLVRDYFELDYTVRKR